MVPLTNDHPPYLRVTVPDNLYVSFYLSWAGALLHQNRDYDVIIPYDGRPSEAVTDIEVCFIWKKLAEIVKIHFKSDSRYVFRVRFYLR